MYEELVKDLREAERVTNEGGNMSVLIKGMEMPRPGHIVLVEIDENGDVFAAYDGGRTKLTQHKAIPVPQHGRCIDVDALIKKLTIDDLDDHNGATLLMAVFLEVLKAAPTIIPADGGAE